ncbi:MAG: M23 family metallopeptidase [Patescibacteria group bacterium]
MKNMRRNTFFTIIGALVAIFLLLAFAVYRKTPFPDFFSRSFMEQGGIAEKEKKLFFSGDAPSTEQETRLRLVEPVENFAKRVFKKPFGILISPENSPISPEKFRGYHTGADAEIFPGEEKKNIFVSAVADGTVISARFAVGYGGLVVIEHEIEELIPNKTDGHNMNKIKREKIYGIYGHIRLSSVIIRPNDQVKAGDIIGVLGEAYSDDAGGERKHLHFGLFSVRNGSFVDGQGAIPDIRGYVEKKEELFQWRNPLQFF